MDQSLVRRFPVTSALSCLSGIKVLLVLSLVSWLVGCTSPVSGDLGSGSTGGGNSSKGNVFEWLGGVASLLSGWVTGAAPSNYSSYDGMLNSPSAVAIDHAGGFMYVADKNNHRIEKYKLSTAAFVGAIGNLQGDSNGTCPSLGSATGWCTGGHPSSGSGDGAFRGPTALALDASASYLYVADTSNNRVSKYNATTGAYVGSIGKLGAGYLSTTKQIAGPQTFSLSAWFKTTTSAGGEIIGFTNYQTGQAYSWDRHIYMGTDGKVTFGVWPGSSQVVTTTAAYNDGSWHHVVGTFTANSLILYMDGAVIGSLTTTAPYAAAYVGYWRIGYYQSGWPNGPAGHYFEATIDDVGVWSSVLSAADVSTLYTSTSGLGPASPQWSSIAYAWNLDETSGTSFADISGHGNTAQAQGYTQANATGKFNGGISFPPAAATTGWHAGDGYDSGAGDGMFNAPNGLAVDSTSGFLYVADTGNHRVQKFSLSSGAFVGAVGNTSASTGTCAASGAAANWCTGGAFASGAGDGMFNSPSGLAIDSSGGSLYVSESGNHRISKLSLATGAFVGAVGNTSASTGTCPVSGATTVWCTGGTFTSGGSDGMFNQPGGLSLDANGYLYVADTSNQRVTKYKSSTGAYQSSTGALGGGYISTTTNVVDPQTFSLSAWFKTTSKTGGEIVGFINTQTGAAGSWDRHIYMGADGRVTFGVFAGNGLANTVTSTSTYNDGTWHNAVGTYTANSLFFYVDGVMIGSLTTTVPNAQHYNGYWRMGYYERSWPNGPSGHYFAAAIDDVGVWSTVLSASDVSALYASGIGLGPASPQWASISYAWNFNEASGPTFADITGNGNTAHGQGYYQANSTGHYGAAINLPAAVAANAWHTGDGYGTGTGDGMLSSPAGLAVDAAGGFLYVADTYNHRIQKFNLSSGAFVGAAGVTNVTAASKWTADTDLPASGYGRSDGKLSWPGGIATDSVHGYFYVADSDNNRIVKYDLSTGAFVGAIGALIDSTGTCPASGAATGWCTGGTFTYGSGDGMFNWPSSVHVDPVNDVLYVADVSNHRVTKHALSTGAFIGAIGNTSDSTGTCPVSGAAPGWCTGGAFSTGASDGKFRYPYDMVADLANDILYITDYGNHRIVKVKATTGSFIGAIGKLSATSGTCPASGAATGWCTGGTFTADATDGTFRWPGGLGLDLVSGHLFVNDYGNNRLIKLNATTGAFIGAIGGMRATTGTCPASGAASGWCTGGTPDGGTGDGYFLWPWSTIVVDHAHDVLYTTDGGNNRVSKFKLSTGAFIGNIGGLSASSGTCPSSGSATTWCTGGSFVWGNGKGRFSYPEYMAMDSSGNLLVVDYGNHRIVKVSIP